MTPLLIESNQILNLSVNSFISFKALCSCIFTTVYHFTLKPTKQEQTKGEQDFYNAQAF